VQSVFTMRVKRNDARWKEATVDEVIDLRARALSDR
jgi:hypothetical protein